MDERWPHHLVHQAVDEVSDWQRLNVMSLAEVISQSTCAQSTLSAMGCSGPCYLTAQGCFAAPRPSQDEGATRPVWGTMFQAVLEFAEGPFAAVEPPALKQTGRHHVSYVGCSRGREPSAPTWHLKEEKICKLHHEFIFVMPSCFASQLSLNYSQEALHSLPWRASYGVSLSNQNPNLCNPTKYVNTTNKNMGWTIEAWLSCYLVLLSTDSKTR